MPQNRYFDNHCESILLSSYTHYLSILRLIQKDTTTIQIVQVDGADSRDPVIAAAETRMKLEKREEVLQWYGTMRRGMAAVRYTFLKSPAFFDYLRGVSSFFLILSEDPFKVRETEFGMDDIAFLDSDGDVLFYTTTHEGFAYLHRKYLQSRNKSSVEELYWSRGLHDAVITAADMIKTSRGSGLTLRVDASGALMDREVRAITFLNCRIISGCAELAGAWWLGDELKKENGAYVLDLELQPRGQRKKTHVILRFRELEVERNAWDPRRYR